MMQMLRMMLLWLALGGMAEPSPFALAGALTQGGMAVGRAPAGTMALQLDGVPVALGVDGRFVIGFGREAPAVALLEAQLANGSVVSEALPIAPRTFRIQRINGLPPREVTFTPLEQEQYDRERALVKAARAAISQLPHWAEPFAWPARGRISGVYGSQRILNGEPRAPHYGVDVAGPVGRLVTAPGSGVVTLAETGFLLEGGIVIIDHGLGVFSTLFHLNSVAVRAGQAVVRGTPIGTIGQTGRATGPHVDWRMNWGDVRLDPALLAGPFPGL